MKQIHFQHKNGATKAIPGVKHDDLSPRLVPKTEYNEGTKTQHTVLRAVPHVVKINLLPEEPAKLTAAQEKMSSGLKTKLIEKNEEIALANIEANQRVLQAVQQYELVGGLHNVEVKEVDDLQILADDAVSVDISEIALADYANRGIPVPEYIRQANPEKIAAFERSRKNEERSVAAAKAEAEKSKAKTTAE